MTPDNRALLQQLATSINDLLVSTEVDPTEVAALQERLNTLTNDLAESHRQRDAAEAEIVELNDTVTTLQAGLASRDKANDTLTTQVGTLQHKVNALTGEVATLTARSEVLQQEVDRLQALVDGDGGDGGGEEPPPPTPFSRSFIGACPSATGGNSADVVAKYGDGAAVRTFSTGGMSAPNRVDGAGIWHHSWKPALGTNVPDDVIIASLADFKDGDIVTLHHETPTKLRDGRMTVAEGEQHLTQFNAFHDAVVRLREKGDIPKVLTSFVDAAWMWDNTANTGAYRYPGKDTDPKTAAWWGSRIKCDLIGVDLDAYQNITRYPRFEPVIDNVIAFCKQYGFSGWTIPEFIHPRRQDSTGKVVDVDGTERAAWLTSVVDYAMAQELKPVAIMLFDTEWAGRPNQTIAKPSKEYTAIMDLKAKLAA